MKRIVSLVLTVLLFLTGYSNAYCETDIGNFVYFDSKVAISYDYTSEDWLANSGMRATISSLLALDLFLDEQFKQLNFDILSAQFHFSGVAKYESGIIAYCCDGERGVIIAFYPPIKETAYWYLDYATPLTLHSMIVDACPNEWYLNDVNELVSLFEEIRYAANN